MNIKKVSAFNHWFINISGDIFQWLVYSSHRKIFPEMLINQWLKAEIFLSFIIITTTITIHALKWCRNVWYSCIQMVIGQCVKCRFFWTEIDESYPPEPDAVLLLSFRKSSIIADLKEETKISKCQKNTNSHFSKDSDEWYWTKCRSGMSA